MSENNKKNISIEEIPLVFKSVKISNDIKVLILGGGNAAGIKYRSFDKKSFKIDIYSEKITDRSILMGLEDRDNISNNDKLDNSYKRNNINELECNKEKRFQADENENEHEHKQSLARIRRLEKYEDIDFLEYGIIVIATDNQKFNEEVKDRCLRKNKLFIYCPDFKKGNTSIPMEIETISLTASLGTKVGSPETVRFISNKIESLLKEYDDFVIYVGKIREISKEKRQDKSRRKELMKFINSDDFYFFYKKGKADTILKMFYGDDYIENNSWD